MTEDVGVYRRQITTSALIRRETRRTLVLLSFVCSSLVLLSWPISSQSADVSRVETTGRFLMRVMRVQSARSISAQGRRPRCFSERAMLRFRERACAVNTTCGDDDKCGTTIPFLFLLLLLLSSSS